ncbi:hypothetical protein FACHB389_15825 [Nostoc calcicola FACHB-389]|nr:hypothetical protein [Nostoc calcicola FACHB-3891]OKH34418.1 hypothetical protein FACHB389_15825 [Nostoc calcicola FACHB-389]
MPQFKRVRCPNSAASALFFTFLLPDWQNSPYLVGWGGHFFGGVAPIFEPVRWRDIAPLNFRKVVRP